MKKIQIYFSQFTFDAIDVYMSIEKNIPDIYFFNLVS